MLATVVEDFIESKLILSVKDGFTESLIVTAQAAKGWEEVGERFKAGDPVARISWESSAPVGGGDQRSTLQPVTAEELEKFGLMCIEIAKGMRK